MIYLLLIDYKDLTSGVCFFVSLQGGLKMKSDSPTAESPFNLICKQANLKLYFKNEINRKLCLYVQGSGKEGTKKKKQPLRTKEPREFISSTFKESRAHLPDIYRFYPLVLLYVENQPSSLDGSDILLAIFSHRTLCPWDTWSLGH